MELMAPSFEQATRQFTYPLDSKNITAGRRLTFPITKVGFLQGIALSITGTVTGTITSPNPLGKSSIVKDVRVAANTIGDIHRFSGPAYFYLIREFLEDNRDMVPFTDGKSAVAAAAFDLSMWIPLAVNSFDQKGLIFLQTDKSVLTLEVEIEADLNIGTGATIATCVVAPTVYGFKVPLSENSYPNRDYVHSIMEETLSITATSGKQKYAFPVGDAYLGAYLGYGIGVSGADKFTEVEVEVGTDRIEYWTPGTLDIDYGKTHGRARPKGVIPLDWMSRSGLGSYGSMRDAIASGAITEFNARINVNAADTLRAVRRTLIRLS